MNAVDDISDAVASVAAFKWRLAEHNGESMVDSSASADRALPSEESMLALLAKTCATAWRLPLSRSDLDEWLSNFSGDVHSPVYERKLALWLLLNFVYYNYEEVKHLSQGSL